MDTLEMAKALLGGGQQKSGSTSGGQTTTAYGTAVGDSADGKVMVDFGGETSSYDDEQAVEVDTTFFVKDGDQVIVSLVGADGTGKAPVVTGVVGRGDETQTEIKSVTNYFWHDSAGAHVSTQDHSVAGNNVLLDSDSLDIRFGNSDSEADQTVLASFGTTVTVGSRDSAGLVGAYSHVFGQNCIASGSYSHAEGKDSVASGNYSHAEGQAAATGNYSHAEAVGNASGQYSHAEGTSSASGLCSHGEGSGSKASGLYSHAEGYETVSSGDYSHAEGYETTASGEHSHAEGHTTTASGLYAHAEGQQTTANGYDAHAEGRLSQALWSHSHAEGYGTIAQNYEAHAEGLYTLAYGKFQHAQGKCNIADNNDTYADIIGNGADENTRSNAYNLDWNGNAEFQGSLYEGGCTPNGETPYPVVRYNTSASQSEYWNGSAWAEVPKDVLWVNVWENSSSAEFAAQTVSGLDLSEYELIAITFARYRRVDGVWQSVSNLEMDTCIVPSAASTGFNTRFALYGTTEYSRARYGYVTNTSVVFEDGKQFNTYGTNTSTTNNSLCIPYRIYGIKKSGNGSGGSADFSVRTVTYSYSLTANGTANTNLKTLIDADLPNGYRCLGIVGQMPNSSYCMVANCRYYNSNASLQIRNMNSGGSISGTLTIDYLAVKV